MLVYETCPNMQRAKKDQRKRQSAPDWQVAVEFIKELAYEAYLRCPQDDWVSTPARLLQIYMVEAPNAGHAFSQMVSMAPYSLKIVPMK